MEGIIEKNKRYKIGKKWEKPSLSLSPRSASAQQLRSCSPLARFPAHAGILAQAHSSGLAATTQSSSAPIPLPGKLPRMPRTADAVSCAYIHRFLSLYISLGRKSYLPLSSPRPCPASHRRTQSPPSRCSSLGGGVAPRSSLCRGVRAAPARRQRTLLLW